MRLRTGRNRFSLTSSISTPWTFSEPPLIGVSPAMARPIVVLPLPDSPTRPSTSPGPDGQVDAVDGHERGLPQAARVDDPQVGRLDDRRRGLVDHPGLELVGHPHPVAQPAPADARDGVQQPARVLVLRRREQRAHVGLLDDLARCT